MIFSYIERSVTRKTHLINLLYCAKNQTIETLALQLGCSPLTVMSDIDYLRTELAIPIVENQELFQLLPTETETLQCYIKKVYQTSLFLQFLAYFVTLDKPKFGSFVASQHVSIAKGYRLREDIIKYLHSIHLDVIDNTIAGNTILIRFFIAELVRTFGLDVLTPIPAIDLRCQRILDQVEENLHINFSNHERQLYSLLINTSISSDIPNSKITFTAAELRGLTSQLYPSFYLELVKNELLEFWPEKTQQQELNFATLAFIVINSHLFDKSVSPAQREIYQTEFLKLPEVNSLITDITSTFKIQPQLLPYFYTAVYTFLSDALFRLQPIFSYPVYSENMNKPHIFNKISSIIQNWNVFGIEIEKYRILDFCNRLSPIIAPQLYQKIIILTERVVDGNFLRDYLSILTPDIEVNIKKDVNYLQNFQEDNTFYIVDKELRIPFQLKQNAENLNFIFFPVREQTLFKLLTKIFK